MTRRRFLRNGLLWLPQILPISRTWQGGVTWPNLAGWWPLADKASGDVVTMYDYSGNGFNLAGHGSSFYPQGAASSLVFGKCVSFDSSRGQYGISADTGVAALVAGLAGATVCGWGKGSGSLVGLIAGFTASSTVNFFALCNVGYVDGYCSDGTYNRNYFTGSPTDGLWHHYCVIFDGSLTAANRIRIFQDTVLLSPVATGGAPPTVLGAAASLGTFRLMWDVADGVYGGHALNDIRLYALPLTQAQINHVYGGGNGCLTV